MGAVCVALATAKVGIVILMERERLLVRFVIKENAEHVMGLAKYKDPQNGIKLTKRRNFKNSAVCRICGLHQNNPLPNI